MPTYTIDQYADFNGWAGIDALGSARKSVRKKLRGALSDESYAVRTAAAKALCHAGECDDALGVLIDNLRNEQEHVSLRAANALHQLGERARPVLAEMEEYRGDAEKLPFRDFFRATNWSQKVLTSALRDLER